MRHSFASLLLVLALAGCGDSARDAGGNASLERADGSFDRARYLEISTNACTAEMRSGGGPTVSEETAKSRCRCIMSRVIAGSSDAELRAYRRDGRVPLARSAAAAQQCQNQRPGPSYELPGGGFDRARFRAATLRICRARLGRAAGVPAGNIEPVCGCVAARLLDRNDDAALRAIVRDARLANRSIADAMAQCRASGAGPGSAAEPAAAGGAAQPARPRANLGSYLSPDDYPAAALRNNQQGRVAFTLDVGPDGRVTACRVRESSGSAALDQATCRIMQSRARFTPALDAQGLAVAGQAQAAVTWVLPEG